MESNAGVHFVVKVIKSPRISGGSGSNLMLKCMNMFRELSPKIYSGKLT